MRNESAERAEEAERSREFWARMATLPDPVDNDDTTCATVDCTTATNGRVYCDDCNGLTPDAICDACHEPLDDPEGLSEPNHLHCDLCSEVEHAADLTPDWNGETGNHRSCEASARDARSEHAISKMGR